MANSSGGYDYQFVDDPPQEILICKICLLASRDPYLSVCCGHVFCKSCIDSAKQNTAIVKACPICRNQEFTTVVNKQVDRLVKSLNIFCTNKGKGCKWQGELNNIDNHLHSGDGCQFEDILCTNECGKVVQRCNLKSHLDSDCPHHKSNCLYCHIKIEHKLYSKHKKECPKFPVPCPNKCKVGNIPRENLQKHLGDCMLQNIVCSNKCGVVLQRQFLTYHLKSECPCRRVKCQYCRAQNIYKFIEGQHKNICPKFPVFCSNRCGATIPRKDADEHKKVCPLQRVDCTYHGLGCDDVVIRMNQKKHNEESVEKHLQLVVSELSNTKQKLITTDQMLSETTGKLVDIQMELTNTRKDLALAKREKNEIKQTLACTQMELNSTNNELTAIERGLNRNQRLFTGINERQSMVEQDLVDIKRDLANVSYRVTAMEIVSYQIAKFMNYFTFSSRKIVTAAKWSVCLSAMIKLSESGDQICPVYIKKDKVTYTYRKVWYSNPFYLHEGCKVRLRIDASVCTYDHGPSLQLHFMEDIPRFIPLQGELKVVLVNPDVDGDNQNLILEKVSIRDQLVISKTTLPILTQSNPYYKDDSVIISVSFFRSRPEIAFGIFVLVFIIMGVITLIVEKH